MSSATIELLTSPEFLRALIFGAIAAAMVGAVAHRRPPDRMGLVGIGLTVSFIAVSIATQASTPQLGGVVLVGLIAVGVVGTIQMPLAMRMAAAIPGAWLIAWSIDGLELTARLLILVAIAAGGALVADTDHQYRTTSVGPLLIIISVVGIFFAVPDTESALLLLGVSLPFLLTAWPKPIASLGSPGAMMMTALLMWVAATGSAGRLAVVVGATATLGILVAEPVVRRVVPGPVRTMGGDAVMVAAAQLVVVFVASRLAASARSTLMAVSLASLTLSLAAASAYGLRYAPASAKHDGVLPPNSLDR